MTARDATLALLRAELETAIDEVTRRWGGTFEITGLSVMLEALPHGLVAGADETAPSKAEPVRLDLGRLLREQRR